MDKVWLWIRSVVGLALAVTAINLVHSAGEALFPDAYAGIDSDADRVVLLLVAVLAGTIASFVLGAIARHRLWLHMGPVATADAGDRHRRVVRPARSRAVVAQGAGDRDVAVAGLDRWSARPADLE